MRWWARASRAWPKALALVQAVGTRVERRLGVDAHALVVDGEAPESCAQRSGGRAAQGEDVGESAGALRDPVGALEPGVVAAIRLGAHDHLFLGGADSEMISKMKNYAENMGLAFQIADDILDVTGKEEEMGKKPSEDEKKKKLTYVSLHGMESSREQLHLLTEKAVDAISDYYDNAEFFRDLAFRLEKRTK